MTEDEFREMIPAYALGVLEYEERLALEAHLVSCEPCQADLRAYQSVAQQLPLSLPERQPPAHLKTAILDQVLARQAQSASGQKARSQPQREGVSAWLGAILRPAAQPAFVLAGFFLIAALLVSNVLAWQQLNRVQAEYTANPVVVAMVNTKDAPNAGGIFVIRPGAREGTLMADGLPVLPKEKQYQLWLVKSGKRISGGVFSVSENGYGVLMVKSPQPLQQYDSFGITIEPFGGSPGPTGAKVLGGKSS